jgi:hypothetical protein
VTCALEKIPSATDPTLSGIYWAKSEPNHWALESGTMTGNGKFVPIWHYACYTFVTT